MSTTRTDIQTLPGAAARPARPSRRRLGLAPMVICTAQVMLVLDETIANTARRTCSVPGLFWQRPGVGGQRLCPDLRRAVAGWRTRRRHPRPPRGVITGIALFSSASLLGGLATAEWWLLAARGIEASGAAIAAPTALALIARTLPQGQPRSRTLGVLRHVPIGVLLALAAPSMIPETKGHRGRFDLPGALTGTAGFTLLVDGITRAATGPDGISHRVPGPRDLRHVLLPHHLHADRLGLQPPESRRPYPPLSIGVILVAGLGSRLVTRTGSRPLLPAAVTGRNPTGGRRHALAVPHRRARPLNGQRARPMLLAAIGLGIIFVPSPHRGRRRARRWRCVRCWRPRPCAGRCPALPAAPSTP